MEINNQNSCLHLLLDNALPTFSTVDHTEDIEEIVEFLDDDFDMLKPLFKEKIKFISAPFYSEYSKATKKLEELPLADSLNAKGTYIMPKPDGATYTVFYDFTILRGNEKWNVVGVVVYFLMDPKTPEPKLVHFTNIDSDDILTYTNSGMLKEGLNMESHLTEVLGLILFSKYFKMETKVVLPRRNENARQ